MSGAPLGFQLLRRFFPGFGRRCCRVYVFLFTLFIYSCYHASRKPISVVKAVLHPNCTEIAFEKNITITPENDTFCYWKPFDGPNYGQLIIALDTSFLASYAVAVFLSGQIADRCDLRIYLTVGTLLCGIATASFGLGYFFGIHHLAFYIIMQILNGVVQASGWPAVVACMANWFGKSGRGFLMGLWNSHTSIGNILGSVLAGLFVNYAWGLSFIVPGLLIAFCGVLTFFFLIPKPEDLGFPPTSQLNRKDLYGYSNESNNTSGDSSEPQLPVEPVSSVMGEGDELLENNESLRAISLLSALKVPGVIEYSLCLFFAKLVSYTFLFWLPEYIYEVGHLDAVKSADISAVFDVGGIAGGVLAGFITDRTDASATTCAVMLILAIPTMYLYSVYGLISIFSSIFWLLPLGMLVNGPYALITTAVSADLGSHPSLQSNARALATVSGIIDGTGSAGATLGPFLCGVLKEYSWSSVFIMLIISLALAALLLVRRVRKELRICRSNCRARNELRE